MCFGQDEASSVSWDGKWTQRRARWRRGRKSYSWVWSVNITLSSVVVTLCTTSFDVKRNHTFYPRSVFYGSQNKQRLFPHIAVNWIVFITEMKSVYCAVRTAIFIWSAGEFSCLWPRCDSGLFSRRVLTAVDRIWSQASPCEICGGQCCTGTGFPLSGLDFRYQCHFHRCSILIFVYMLLFPEG
jgi:hypothetical protein